MERADDRLRSGAHLTPDSTSNYTVGAAFPRPTMSETALVFSKSMASKTGGLRH